MTESEYKPKHFAVFSHEFEESTSLPARSYWDIKYGTPNNHVKIGGSLEMSHSSAGNEVERTLGRICYQMDVAVERGKNIKMGEIQTALGIDFSARMKPPGMGGY